MSTQHYTEEPGTCDCRDDSNCGCTYPNNISDYENMAQNTHTKVHHHPTLKKDTICYCTPQSECDCVRPKKKTDNI